MDEWQPIESAPKDGTWIILYRGPSDLGMWDRVIVGKYDNETASFVWPDDTFDIYEQNLSERDENGYFVHDQYECNDFTHWMPLPEQPGITETKVATPPICAQCAFYVPSAGGPSKPYCTNHFVNSDREISIVTGKPTGHAPICEAARRYGGECGPEGKRFKRRGPHQLPPKDY